MDRAIQLSENIDIKDGMTSWHSSPNFVAGLHVNNAGMEEAELSLQGGSSLNYEVGAPFNGMNIVVKFTKLKLSSSKVAEMCPWATLYIPVLYTYFRKSPIVSHKLSSHGTASVYAVYGLSSLVFHFLPVLFFWRWL